MFVSWRLEFSRGPLCRRMCFQSHGRFILFGRRAEHCHVQIPWNQWLVIFCRPECIRRESKFVKTDLGNLVLCFVTWCCVWFEENESNCRNRSIGLKSETEENGKCRSKIDRHPLGNSWCCVWLSTCLAATFFQSVCLSDVVGFARRWVPVQTLGKIYPVQEVRTAWTKLIEGRVLKTKEVRPVRQLWNLRPGMSVFVDQGGIQTLSLARWPKRWTWRLALGNRLQWSRLTWAVVLILSCDWLLLFFGTMEAATKMKAVKVMKRKREAGVNSITGTLQIIVSWIFQAKKKGSKAMVAHKASSLKLTPLQLDFILDCCKILSGAERPPQRPSHLQNRCTDLAEPKRENFEGGKIQSSVKEQVLNSFSCHVMYFDEVRCVLFVLCYVLFGFCFRLLIMGGSLAGRFTAWSCPWDVSSRWSGKWWAPKPSECQMDSNVLCDVNMNRSQTTRRAARRRVAHNCLLGRRSLGPSAQFVRASKTNYQPRTFFESLFGCEVVSVQRHHAVSADCLKGQSPSGPHETDVLMILILATI